MNRFDKQYWTDRWINHQTGWDVGKISDPFVSFFSELKDRELRILIPGGGNGYEGEFLFKQGFRNVYVLDIAHQPLANLKLRLPEFPEENLLCQDFFTLDDSFDLIIEQTFFCALDPSLRTEYVKKMHQLLKPGGRLAGLLFNFPLTDDGPPFGGDENEYRSLFSPYFSLNVLKPAENSIAPRSGRELWFEFTRK
jgi:thiopurine S-methyltransferase